MRIVLCDRCKGHMTAVDQYATVTVGADKYDLCYATCYEAYRALLEDEDKLAASVHENVVERRKAIYSQFAAGMLLKQEGQDAVQY